MFVMEFLDWVKQGGRTLPECGQNQAMCEGPRVNTKDNTSCIPASIALCFLIVAIIQYNLVSHIPVSIPSLTKWPIPLNCELK